MRPSSFNKHFRQLGWQAARAGGLAMVLAGVLGLSFWVCCEGAAAWWPDYWRLLPPVLAAKMGVFLWLRIHQGWLRYTTFYDLVALVKAATAASMLVTLVDHLLLSDVQMKGSVTAVDWGATILAVGGIRLALRLWRERDPLSARQRETPVLIVGANDTGEALLRAISSVPDLRYRVLAFVDLDACETGRRIGGIPVLGAEAEPAAVARRLGAAEVLITSDSLPGIRVRQIVQSCRRVRLRVKVLPSYQQLISGSVALRPRDVCIEDLLRREPVELDLAGIRQWLDGRVLLVTGSAGSIGSEIVRQLLCFAPACVIAVDRSENGQFFLREELDRMAPERSVEVVVADAADAGRMDALFRRFRPDIVFHAAAYKHVGMMESDPGAAVKNNVLATRALAELAERHGVGSFVLVSTDKAVAPTSVMGACKRLAEMYVQAMARQSRCRFVTVRFGNVLDSAGSVVPLFREQIARGGPVLVTDPRMKRYFMTIPEAARLVVQAGALGRKSEIFVLDMGQPVRILDLARDMIRLSGLVLGEDIEIEFCGARPGEKLCEELCHRDEPLAATGHPKISAATGPVYELEPLRRALEGLEARVDLAPDAVRAALAEIVPGYRPTTAAIDAPRLLPLSTTSTRETTDQAA